jgi:thiamine transport system substrate-binding protein
MNRLRVFILLLVLVALAAVAPACRSRSAETVTVRLLTHDSFDISADTVAAFEAQTGHTLEILKGGDAGQMLNQAILARGNPVADVIFGIDNSFLSRALTAGILVAYPSADLADVPIGLQLDPQRRALPVDYGDVCLNYDRAWFAARNLTPPASLAELTDPAWANLLAVPNPATSSPGLAFLLATVALYGEDGFRSYWEGLRANGVRVENGWSAVYYTAFTLYGGDRPIVVSYATSPAAEVWFADPQPDTPPTGAVVAAGTCFRQVEFAGILAGTKQEKAAQQLLDFMLGETFQADIPLHMFVWPANESADVPEIFVRHARKSAEPLTLDPDTITANRERWIESWSRIVLR